VPSFEEYDVVDTEDWELAGEVDRLDIDDLVMEEDIAVDARCESS
jgi:hypothetical protein